MVNLQSGGMSGGNTFRKLTGRKTDKGKLDDVVANIAWLAEATQQLQSSVGLDDGYVADHAAAGGSTASAPRSSRSTQDHPQAGSVNG